MPDGNQRLPVWLDELADRHPRDRLAIIDHDGQRLSYGDLADSVGTLRAALRRHGVRAGDRVMVVTENCAAFAALIIALAGLRAWVLPVNARHSAEEITAIARHAGARCLLFTPDASPASADHAARLEAEHLSKPASGPILATAIMSTEPEETSDDPADQVAALLYTTGTTSAPKGVMLTHGNLMWNAEVSGRTRRLVPDDVILAILPGTHVYCFSSGIIAGLFHGTTVRFVPRFTPEAVLAAFAEGASVMPAVPQMYQAITGLLKRRGERPDAPRLRLISSGGAPLDPDWKRGIEEFFGLTLHNGYGLTETSPGVTVTRIDGPAGDLSCGLPVDGVEVAIDDPDADGIGEVLIRGPNVMKGYYRNPDATRTAIRPDGFFCSGDLGYLGPRGELYIVGRRKELIIRSGFNVFPPEIEAMLTQHPAIAQAAVVGRAVKGDEEIIAFILAEEGLTEAEVKDWLHTRLVAYKIPQHIRIVPGYPTAPTGKILKHKLIETFGGLLP